MVGHHPLEVGIKVRILSRQPTFKKLRTSYMQKKIIIAVVILSFLSILVYSVKKQAKPNIIQTDIAPTAEVNTAPNQNESLPLKYLLEVPFATQAPLENWDKLHEEACEEASIILVDYFWQKKGITPELMEKEIIGLTNWEQKNGYKEDLTVEELAKITQDKYGYKATVSYDVTENSIKKIIFAGKPLIVPLQGQDLGNPYYKQPGPPYHMLVITGYDKSEFITNDVGTKRGKGYRYPFSTLLDAIHDWTGNKDTIRAGKKVMLVIE